jgi:Rrf2 family protein
LTSPPKTFTIKVIVDGFGKGLVRGDWMFRINRRTDYAVRVMLALARRQPGARLPTQMIQEEMLIPRPFLRRIIADLARAQLLRTFPGPNGGLELVRPAAQVNLRHIWEALEGPLLISDCLSGPNACPLEAGCPVNRRWICLQDLIASQLESISLEQLAGEAGLLSDRVPISTSDHRILLPVRSGQE